MKRREFITLLGGVAAWPLAARAQQNGRERRIGVLMTLSAGDPEVEARKPVFEQSLRHLGWTGAQPCRLNIALRVATANPSADMRPNWSRWRPT